MDAARFDALLRSLATGRSRRAILAGMTSSWLVMPNLDSRDEADAKRRKRKRRKKKKPTSPRPCVPNCTGATCAGDGCGGTCSCVAPATCVAGTCVCPGGFPTCGPNATCCDPSSQTCRDTTCVGCTRVGGACIQLSDCCQPVQGQTTVTCGDVPVTPDGLICCRQSGEPCAGGRFELCCSGICFSATPGGPIDTCV
jgi:hypothetical protein